MMLRWFKLQSTLTLRAGHLYVGHVGCEQRVLHRFPAFHAAIATLLITPYGPNLSFVWVGFAAPHPKL
jgi:hypothetical protein